MLKEKVSIHGVSHPLWMVSLAKTDCSLVRPHCQTPPHCSGGLRPIFWQMDGLPCASLPCAPSCTPRLKGVANLPVHNIAHIEP